MIHRERNTRNQEDGKGVKVEGHQSQAETARSQRGGRRWLERDDRDSRGEPVGSAAEWVGQGNHDQSGFSGPGQLGARSTPKGLDTDSWHGHTLSPLLAFEVCIRKGL